MSESAIAIAASWSTKSKTARCIRMEQRARDDPLDADAWVVVLAEACEQQPADFRPLFQRCVQHFPSAPSVWYQWLDAEQRNRDMVAMEGIFEQCLLRCPHVELWRLYLNYLRNEKRSAPKELQQAYELLLDAVGDDVNSGPLWVEYTSLMSDLVEPGAMPMAKSVSDARDAFQRALAQPAMGLEALWKEYEAWEQSMSGGGAKAVLAEIADRALVARRVAKERAVLASSLKLSRMPRVPRGAAMEAADLTAWRDLWTYEGENPQRLDSARLMARMNFTFNQALMVCWFTPQVWHEAAMWMHENGNAAGATDFYRRALEVLPSFWPLVALHEEHTAWRGRRNSSRADCTHWLPCSSAMHLQLRLLVAGLRELKLGGAG